MQQQPQQQYNTIKADKRHLVYHMWLEKQNEKKLKMKTG